MKTLNNIAHFILMAFVWNYIAHITGLSSMVITPGVIIGIVGVTFVAGGLIGGGNEWMQAQIDKSNFDKIDIFTTIAGGFFGALTAVNYPQYKSELLFDLSIVVYLLYWVTIAVKLRRKKKVIPSLIKLLLIGLSLLVLFVLTSCEEEIIYKPLPQRAIPIEYMSEKDAKIISQNNEHRLPMLLIQYKTSLDLFHLAQSKAIELHESDSLSHLGWIDRYEQSGALFFGESVAYGYVTAESTLAAYYGSPDHRPMFESQIYEYVASASYGQYNCVLVARYRPYKNQKLNKSVKVTEIRTGNISTKQIMP